MNEGSLALVGISMDVQADEGQEKTSALLEILALGNREIMQGMFRDIEDVFADLDKTEQV